MVAVGAGALDGSRVAPPLIDALPTPAFVMGGVCLLAVIWTLAALHQGRGPWLIASLSLPLVGGGDHDWNELFFRWGMLGEPAVRRISGVTHGIGVLLMLFALMWSLYYVLPLHQQRGLVTRWPQLRRLVGDV